MAVFALLLFIVFVLQQERNHPLAERLINIGLLTTGVGILVIGLVSYEIKSRKFVCIVQLHILQTLPH